MDSRNFEVKLVLVYSSISSHYPTSSFVLQINTESDFVANQWHLVLICMSDIFVEHPFHTRLHFLINKLVVLQIFFN